ncbi:MAG TPA: PIG-L family deacetylase [Ignavibacteriaceae bacterium]|jgi:LmbE family N-acetylglucosaminyl deacetylase|nr:MAG: PIG-L domain-containing protein [Ignavibacteriota bacterium]HMN15984.1 PIG-L family deacetylase [Ignavibacteriaceae bacterium]
MKNRILILSPHTDDAELGCGGSIIKFIDEKKEILWCVFSSAEDSVPDNLPKDTIKKEFIEVCKKLNLVERQYVIYNYGVRKLPEYRQEILEILVQIKKLFTPDLVIGPSLNDYHQDHLVVANEMIRAYKDSSSIISYELPWNHVTFSNQMFIKLKKENIDRKFDLLSSYKSQTIKKRSYFSKDFIYGLSKTRGIQINTEYAEAFEVIRWIY